MKESCSLLQVARLLKALSEELNAEVSIIYWNRSITLCASKMFNGVPVQMKWPFILFELELYDEKRGEWFIKTFVSHAKEAFNNMFINFVEKDL